MEDPVRHLDTLAAVDLAQAFDELSLAAGLVQLARCEVLLVAQGVDHVHRQHQPVELLRLDRGRTGRRRERAASCSSPGARHLSH